MEFVDRLIKTLVNLVGRIYGKFYFPTYSNSLKEIGRYLGFEWTWPGLRGCDAFLRRAWELVADEGLKRELIGYNMDDCRAAATVAEALVRICDGGPSGLVAVHVGSLEVGFEQTWGKFDSALPEFTKINDAAYWDYQRDRIYIRSNPYLRKAAKESSEETSFSRYRRDFLPSCPSKCPTCNSKRLFMNGRHRRILCLIFGSLKAVFGDGS